MFDIRFWRKNAWEIGGKGLSVSGDRVLPMFYLPERRFDYGFQITDLGLKKETVLFTHFVFLTTCKKNGR
jgi:hypothetical protein